MSKPVLAVGLLATMVGASYWAMQPHAQLVVSRRSPSAPLAAARPLPYVPAVRLADLAVEAASRPTPAGGRNPFADSGAAPQEGSVSTGMAAVPEPRTAVAPVPAAPVWPRLELIGVAEGREGAGVVRIAIVSGPHGVHHARAGDVLEQVYRVERIGGDGVDVRLLPEDRALRLALRR